MTGFIIDKKIPAFGRLNSTAIVKSDSKTAALQISVPKHVLREAANGVLVI